MILRWKNMYDFKWKTVKSRKIILVLFDMLCIAAVAAVCFSVSYRLDADFQGRYAVNDYVVGSAILIACMLACRMIAGIYLSIWRYTNTSVYLRMVLADAAGVLIAFAIRIGMGADIDLWRSVTVAALSTLLTLISRFAYRLIYKFRKQTGGEYRQRIPVAIVGAGQVGVLLANELLYGTHSGYQPLFFIDRDTAKVGSRLSGLKVYAEDARIASVIREHGVNEIFIALRGLDSEMAAALYERYYPTGCRIKIYDLPLKDAAHAQEGDGAPPARGILHDFRIEDLLFRESHSINNSESFAYYTGKKVLITGGGGSIGSELCRQIAACDPEQLIIVDIYENNAYEIQQELLRKYSESINLAVEIASVRDRERLDCIFAHYRPDVVFHAAAHKHVPLMEHNACEAIKNNVLGTYHTADMAEKYGVKKFILISTDKAVNPTNIMGASKRICEMIVQCRTDSRTCFAAVRFGNVLGSNGSAIPLFRKQIAEGGPVTVTDRRIIRYFMTIPEAAQLVVQAGAMAKDGELFVLDMGKPIRIYDLALNMIKLCGLRPNVDIQIQEIGLRPGEKLYEELLIKTETLTKTDNSMIFIETDAPLSREEVQAKIDDLTAVLSETENELASVKIRDAMHRAVPTFREPEEINRSAAASDEMRQAQTV